MRPNLYSCRAARVLFMPLDPTHPASGTRALPWISKLCQPASSALSGAHADRSFSVGMVRRVGKGVNKVCRSAMGLREGGNVHTAAAADNGTRVGCESGAQQGQGGGSGGAPAAAHASAQEVKGQAAAQLGRSEVTAKANGGLRCEQGAAHVAAAQPAGLHAWG